jgi:hypothetical protein
LQRLKSANLANPHVGLTADCGRIAAPQRTGSVCRRHRYSIAVSGARSAGMGRPSASAVLQVAVEAGLGNGAGAICIGAKARVPACWGDLMIARFNQFLINTALVVASVLLTYVLLEFAVFKLFLPLMPLKVRPALPDRAEVLAQNSKLNYLPHDYIALLGDSYAEGRGDWLLQGGGDRNKPFHSADVIRAATGRDVVSFARGGAGSAEGIVLRPARIFTSSQCVLFPEMEIPRQMFIYFYEGNDIDDNLNFAFKAKGAYGRIDGGTIDRYLTENYAAENPWRCHLELLDTATRMTKFLYQHYVSGLDLEFCGQDAPGTNRLVAGGRSFEAPALQGPALAYSDEAIQLGIEVLDHSLSWLQRRFKDVPVTVVYVPSPLSIYRSEGETEVYCGAGPTTAGVARSLRNSDLIADSVGKTAIGHAMDFMDARPALRSAAAMNVIHGPRDWDHLNEIGYRALGRLVASGVRAQRSD